MIENIIIKSTFKNKETKAIEKSVTEKVQKLINQQIRRNDYITD